MAVRGAARRRADRAGRLAGFRRARADAALGALVFLYSLVYLTLLFVALVSTGRSHERRA